MKYLVYMKGLRRPEAQIWYGPLLTGTGLDQHKPVAEGGKLVWSKELLDADQNLNIDELIDKYPCPMTG